MQILIVEDNADLAANVGEFLTSRGCKVDYGADGLTGLHLAAVNSYDAIVLDLNLPGMDGISLCQRLRQEARTSIPILMLTARDTERDKIGGFDAGADDYLTKPFSLAELHARLKALTRRHQGHQSVLQVADLTLDLQQRVVRRGTRRVDPTRAAMKLLEALMRASPGVLTRDAAERAIWGDHPPDNEASLRGHVHALRRQIDDGESVKLLHTLHGVGYRLVADADD